MFILSFSSIIFYHPCFWCMQDSRKSVGDWWMTMCVFLQLSSPLHDDWVTISSNTVENILVQVNRLHKKLSVLGWNRAFYLQYLLYGMLTDACFLLLEQSSPPPTPPSKKTIKSVKPDKTKICFWGWFQHSQTCLSDDMIGNFQRCVYSLRSWTLWSIRPEFR